MSNISTLPRRTRLFKLICLVFSLLFVVNPVLAGCQSNSQSPATPVPGAMASPEYAMQVFVWGTPNSVTQRDLRLVKDAGFTWVKQMFPWNWIEGNIKGVYEWNEPDRILKATSALDL
ncbi:MAG: hypothetical protein Q7O66_08020, partial [Dehalococcoidia bacterium]|nr:hypothetical protein [Dehalococcoidia bacterium]